VVRWAFGAEIMTCGFAADGDSFGQTAQLIKQVIKKEIVARFALQQNRK
jgi:hypothetical protein